MVFCIVNGELSSPPPSLICACVLGLNPAKKIRRSKMKIGKSSRYPPTQAPLLCNVKAVSIPLGACTALKNEGKMGKMWHVTTPNIPPPVLSAWT